MHIIVIVSLRFSTAPKAERRAAEPHLLVSCIELNTVRRLEHGILLIAFLLCPLVAIKDIIINEASVVGIPYCSL